MALCPEGTYIGQGYDTKGDKVSYTIQLKEKKACWLDYRCVSKIATAPIEKFHAEGSFVFTSRTCKITLGGLPGQKMTGQVWDFEVVDGAAGAKVLSREGVSCQPQADAVDCRGNCDICGKMLSGVTIASGGGNYHTDCFVCSGCKQPLTGAFAKTPDGKRMCASCNPKNMCVTCGGEIHGKMTTVGTNIYHPECLICSTCNEPLVGGYAKKGDRLLCKPCLEGEAKGAPKRAAAPKPQPKAAPPPEARPAPIVANAYPKTEAPKKPIMRIGTYIGKGKWKGEAVLYSIRLMKDFRIWLHGDTSNKIATSSWQAEGFYTETSKMITFTVDVVGQCNVGDTFDMAVPDSATIIYEGVKCSYQEGVPELDIDDYMKAAEAQGPSAKLIAERAAREKLAVSALLPSEGIHTRLMMGAKDEMARTEIDKKNRIIKTDVKAADGSASKFAMGAKDTMDRTEIDMRNNIVKPRPGSPSGARAASPSAKAGSSSPRAGSPSARGGSPKPASKPAASSSAPPPAGCLSLKDLQSASVCKAKGVDMGKREEYLSDADFKATFGMNKADFAAQPKWKKDGQKKKENIF